MKNLSILFVFVLIGFLFSCKKKSSSIENAEYKKNEAVLKWVGDYAADGCGFFLIMDNHQYKPDNESIISNSFKKDSTLVIIEYQFLNKKIESWCGDWYEPIYTDGIKIISITKK